MVDFSPTAKRWIKYLIAIVAGNLIYLFTAPHLPPAARHHPYRADIGLFVDLWFCVAVYGLIELLVFLARRRGRDRKSTRLNSSHPSISYAVFCLKKKNKQNTKQLPIMSSYIRH